jgi:repressor of nif and glnA expression
MYKEPFFNTVGLEPQLCLEFNEKNKKQNDVILSIFEAHPDTSFTSREVETVLKGLGYDILLTSIRRSLTTLERGLKIKTVGKVTGKYKVPNYKYQLI